MSDNTLALEGLLELAKEFGCVMTVDEIRDLPSEDDLKKSDAKAIQNARQRGLRIVDAELSKKLRHELENVESLVKSADLPELAT